MKVLQLVEKESIDPRNSCSECEHTSYHCPYYFCECCILPAPIKMIKVAGNGSDINSFLISDVLVSDLEYKWYKGIRSHCFMLSPAEVSFIDAIFFCNQLSLNQGRTPAYSLFGVSDNLTNEEILKKKISDKFKDPDYWIKNLIVDNEAGYRLPTEREWRWATNNGKEYLTSGYEFKYAGSNNLSEISWIQNKFPPFDIHNYKPNELQIYGFCGYVWQHVENFNDGKSLRLGGSYASPFEQACELTFKGMRSDLFENKAGIRLVLPFR